MKQKDGTYAPERIEDGTPGCESCLHPVGRTVRFTGIDRTFDVCGRCLSFAQAILAQPKGGAPFPSPSPPLIPPLSLSFGDSKDVRISVKRNRHRMRTSEIPSSVSISGPALGVRPLPVGPTRVRGAYQSER